MQNVQTPKIKIGTMLKDGATTYVVRSIKTNAITLDKQESSGTIVEVEAGHSFVEEMEICNG